MACLQIAFILYSLGNKNQKNNAHACSVPTLPFGGIVPVTNKVTCFQIFLICGECAHVEATDVEGHLFLTLISSLTPDKALGSDVNVYWPHHLGAKEAEVEGLQCRLHQNAPRSEYPCGEARGPSSGKQPFPLN